MSISSIGVDDSGALHAAAQGRLCFDIEDLGLTRVIGRLMNLQPGTEHCT